ncbi:MAG: enoyl-CoA hydratase/isomerase family protein [Deltaproteobacteria bacterium]|nr:enoyl-CoA hydratase/isomerase family protein [Deltaproteobacteria bacterium]
MSGALQHIRVEHGAGGVATLTFDRPAARNAMHLEMNLEVRRALDTLAEDESVRALVLTGAGGRAFVSGADIAELRDRSAVVALARHNARLCDALEAFPRPTVAAIEGYALGGGCEVALACDLRVAGASARLGQPEVSLGILPAAGATWRLPRVVGLGRAKELILTGRIVEADEALGMGLLNRVVPDGGALEAARALAETMAGHSALAVRLAKVAIDGGREASQHVGSMLEALGQALLYDDPDKRERMDAFLAARAARKTRGEGDG